VTLVAIEAAEPKPNRIVEVSMNFGRIEVNAIHLPHKCRGLLAGNVKKITLLLSLVAMVGGVTAATAQKRIKAAPVKQTETKPEDVPRITVDELILMVAKKKPVTIIDVRNLDAYDQKIVGALQIPHDQIEAHLKQIPRDREIVTYCA
jgi:rhodanese-like protein